jgi:hypothetical protein
VLRLVLPSAIALAVVIELALQAEPFVFRELLTAFDPLYLVLGLAISVATLFLRGLRLACVACPKPFEFAPAAWISSYISRFRLGLNEKMHPPLFILY